MDSNNTIWQLGLTIGTRFERLFQLGLHFDCSFSVGRDTNKMIFDAHSLVLATASPVFEAMFFGKMASKEKPIEITDMQPNVFKMLLQYIYSDNVNFSSFTEVCELFYAANKYMLTNLREECNKYILNGLRPDNICLSLELAKLHEEKQIFEECEKIIQEKTEEVFQFPSFLEADISTLETILSQENLKVSDEIDVWNACVRWSSAKCERANEEITGNNLRNKLETAIPLIRFLVMKPLQFAKGPAITNILTQEEAYKILNNLVCCETENMPSNLSTNTSSRCRPDPRLSCRIGNYNSCFKVHNSTPFTFNCSAAIILTGVRLPRYKNYHSRFTAFSISDDNDRIVHDGVSKIVDTPECREYFFGYCVTIEPHRNYTLVLNSDRNTGHRTFKITTPVTCDNVVFNVNKDKSDVGGYNGYCLFAEILFYLP